MNNKILIGDFVDVYFDYCPTEHNVKVLARPQDVGDSWKLKRQNGDLVEVCFYSKMVRKNFGTCPLCGKHTIKKYYKTLGYTKQECVECNFSEKIV